ncbi:MAG: hypothetical protein Q8Q85_03530 [Gemmatimonadales bacterium]|nr:hypothetical protein [Gemmatimonadales bacterium]
MTAPAWHMERATEMLRSRFGYPAFRTGQFRAVRACGIRGPAAPTKRMAAEVLARWLGLDLYRIDLSAVVPKYIGETEKNLLRIFAAAEDSDAMSPPSFSASLSIEKPRNARIRHHLSRLTL